MAPKVKESIGEIVASAIIRFNRVIDHRMNSTAFAEREEEFIEVGKLAGAVIADKIDLTPERLLMLKVGALYATTFSEARTQNNNHANIGF